MCMLEGTAAGCYRVQYTRSARKVHVCESCHRTIQVGWPLVHVVWRAGDEAATEKFCTRCWELYPRMAQHMDDVDVLPWSATWCVWQQYQDELTA